MVQKLVQEQREQDQKKLSDLLNLLSLNGESAHDLILRVENLSKEAFKLTLQTSNLGFFANPFEPLSREINASVEVLKNQILLLKKQMELLATHLSQFVDHWQRHSLLEHFDPDLYEFNFRYKNKTLEDHEFFAQLEPVAASYQRHSDLREQLQKAFAEIEANLQMSSTLASLMKYVAGVGKIKSTKLGEHSECFYEASLRISDQVQMVMKELAIMGSRLKKSKEVFNQLGSANEELEKASS